MNTSTIMESESNTEVVSEQLKLIEGKFTKREALSIVNNLVDVKLNFHKIQRLSRTEGNAKDVCEYDNSRITELIDDRADVKAFLKALENGSKIKIESTIHFTIEE